MNSEPQKPIEGLLHTYAQKRREEAGAPLELHPATRNMLQAEVASIHAPKTAVVPARFDWLKLFLPLAWATCFAAATVMGYLFMSRDRGPAGGKPQQMAQVTDFRDMLGEAMKTAPADGFAFQPAPAPPAEPVPTTTTVLPRTPAPTSPAVVFSEAVAAPLPSGAMTNASVTYLAMKDTEARREDAGVLNAPMPAERGIGDALKLAKQTTEKEQVAKSPDTSLTLAGGMKLESKMKADGADRAAEPSAALGAFSDDRARKLAYEQQAGSRQRYSQVDPRANLRRNFNSPATPPVLKSFDLERTGNQVRLVDADGSVYEGQVIPAPPASEQEAAVAGQTGRSAVVVRGMQFDYQSALRAGQADRSGGQVDPQAVAIRCAGQNTTLNKPVIFEGVLVPEPVTQSAAGAQLNQNQAAQQTLRLQGRVTIGGASQEINAVPTGR